MSCWSAHNIYVTVILEGEKEGGRENILISENFPNLMKDVNIHIWEAYWTQSKMNLDIHIETYYYQIFTSQGQQDNLESNNRKQFIQEIVNKVISRFLITHFWGWKAVGQYILNAKIKKIVSTEDSISGKTVLQKWGRN